MSQFSNRKVKHVQFSVGIQFIGEVKSSMGHGVNNAQMELWPMGVCICMEKGDKKLEKLVPFAMIHSAELFPEEEKPVKEAKK